MHHDAIGAPAPEPYSLILGGSSVRRLMPLVRAALPSCHAILLGGAVANTFLVSRGWQPGASSFAPDELDLARQLFDAATAHRVDVYCPVDGLVRTGPPGPGASFAQRAIDGAFPPSDAVADIGLETINTYREVIARSATVLWVGLMGDCSIPETQVGSLRVGQTAAAVPRALVVGDDTVQAAVFFRLDSRLRVAAGGDRMLELLSDAPFPGLEAVRHRRDGEP